MAGDERMEQYLTAIRAMQDGDFSPPFPADAADSLGKLGVELSKLAAMLERRCKEVELLQAIMHEVSSGLMVDDVLDRIYERFRSIIPYNRMAFALLSDDSRRLTQFWLRSDANEILLQRGYTAPIEDSSLQAVLATGQPRILNDLEAYLAAHPQSPATRLMVNEGMRSNFTCPLVAQGRPIGFLFFTSREKNTYQHVHQQIFLQIAEQVSILIEKQGFYQRLRENEEERYKTIVHTALDGFWLVDAEGYLLDVNDAACELLGYRREELLTMHVSDVEAVETPEETARHIRKVIESGSDRFETRHRCKDGRIVDIEVSTNFYNHEGGRFFSFLRDITGRKRTEEEIRLKALLLDSVNDSVFMVDLDGNIIFVNDTACITRGYTRQEMLDMTLHDLNTPEYAELVKARIVDLLGRGSATFESAHIRKDDSRFPIEVSARVIESAGRKFILSVARDISASKRAEEHAYLANHDILTGLPNRRMLMDRIEHALAQARRYGRLVAVMFLDLDHLKEINDTLGHDVGDKVLISAAQRIAQCVRQEDTVSRLGGDEFVVLLNGIGNAGDVESVAHKILAALALPIALGDQSFSLSGSIGISIYPSDSADAHTLIANADTAMYAAKRAGRSCFRFHRA